MKPIIIKSLLLALFLLTTKGAANAALFRPAPNSPLEVGKGSSEIRLIDLNGDGHLDLLIKHLLAQTLDVYVGNGKGEFYQLAQSSVKFDFMPGCIEVADVNLDGKIDLGVLSKEGQTEYLRIYEGDGKGGFKLWPGSPIALSPAMEWYKPELRFVDLNEDGKPDVIAANGRRNSIEILEGDGKGNFKLKEQVKLKPGRWDYTFEVADLDGDGHFDLVTSSSLPPDPDKAPGEIAIRMGDGKGGFAATDSQTLIVAQAPHLGAVKDINRDGHPDIVVVHGKTNLLTTLLNEGKGNFRISKQFKVEKFPFEMVVADINLDDRADLAVVTVSGKAPFESSMEILIGDGKGEFKTDPGSVFPASLGAYNMALGDINEDGKTDVITSSFESSKIVLLLGQ
jgi:hypothetical protein